MLNSEYRTGNNLMLPRGEKSILPLLIKNLIFLRKIKKKWTFKNSKVGFLNSIVCCKCKKKTTAFLFKKKL